MRALRRDTRRCALHGSLGTLDRKLCLFEGDAWANTIGDGLGLERDATLRVLDLDLGLPANGLRRGECSSCRADLFAHRPRVELDNHLVGLHLVAAPNRDGRDDA